MDHRLIFTVLLMTLSWRFIGNYAQGVNTTTTTTTVVSAVTTNSTMSPTTTLTGGSTLELNTTISTTTETTGGSTPELNTTMATTTETTGVSTPELNTTMATTTETTGGSTPELNTTMATTTETTGGSTPELNTTMSTTTETTGGSTPELNTTMETTTETTGGSTLELNTTMSPTTTSTGGSTLATNTTMATTTETTGGSTRELNTTMSTTTETTGGSTPELNTTMSTTTATTATTVEYTMPTTTSTTLAPTVPPNDTVVALDTPISRSGCGSQQLCAAEPAMCDPSSAVTCFFLAAKQQSGHNFEFKLAGESDGYIAATLATVSRVGDTTYVCANSGGNVSFFGAVLNNGTLTKSTVSANMVKGLVSGRKIQCTFLASVPRATGVTLSVSSGAYNQTTEDLGDPSPVIRAAVANLSDPNANATNEITFNTTTLTVVTTNATNVAPGRANTTVAANTTATIPVATLVDSITTTDCGSKKLCVAEPTTCDPSSGNPCYFVSAKQQSGQLYDFELSGESDGYIAAGLSTSSNEADSHQAYICANHNGTVRFFTGTLTNFLVNLALRDVSNVTGKINSSKIQCTFGARLPNTTTGAAGYALSVSIGTYNPATAGFGPAFFRIQTPVVNLSDPNATISNLVNNTNSTSGAYPVAHQQSLMMPALLLIVTTLAFTMQ